MAHHMEFRPQIFEIFGQLPLDLLQSPRTNSGEDSNCVIRNKNITKNQRRSYRGPNWYRARDSCTPKLKTKHSYYLRVTFVWATKGSRTGRPLEEGETISKLEEWAEAEVVPDVVLVGEYKILPLSHGEQSKLKVCPFLVNMESLRFVYTVVGNIGIRIRGSVLLNICCTALLGRLLQTLVCP